MHLTNYAINKDHEDFQPNEDAKNFGIGSKRSMSSVMEQIEDEFGKDKREKIEEQIYDMAIKSIAVVQPQLAHLFKSCQPDDIENQMCFQILGLDVMLEQRKKNTLVPYLIEIN